MRPFVTAVIIMAAASFIAGCAASGPCKTAGDVLQSDFCVEGLFVTITTDKREYRENEAVNAKAIFTNCSEEVLQFPICEDMDRNLFFDVLLVGPMNQTILIRDPGDETRGTWGDLYNKDVKIINLRPRESYTVNLPAILPATFFDRYGGYDYDMYPDWNFDIYLIYRDYSFGHLGNREPDGSPKGKYWEGVCLSKPAKIAFTDCGDQESAPTEPEGKPDILLTDKQEKMLLENGFELHLPKNKAMEELLRQSEARLHKAVSEKWLPADGYLSLLPVRGDDKTPDIIAGRWKVEGGVLCVVMRSLSTTITFIPSTASVVRLTLLYFWRFFS